MGSEIRQVSSTDSSSSGASSGSSRRRKHKSQTSDTRTSHLVKRSTAASNESAASHASLIGRSSKISLEKNEPKSQLFDTAALMIYCPIHQKFAVKDVSSKKKGLWFPYTVSFIGPLLIDNRVITLLLFRLSTGHHSTRRPEDMPNRYWPYRQNTCPVSHKKRRRRDLLHFRCPN